MLKDIFKIGFNFFLELKNILYYKGKEKSYKKNKSRNKKYYKA